jgi:bacterioferritin
MKSKAEMIKPKAPSATPLLSNIAELRRRARQHIEDGAVTANYEADRTVVIKMLNEALATELVCVLRYRSHYFLAEGLPAEAVKKEFLAHAIEEQGHADLIAGRIVQLGGVPDFDPAGLTARSHSEYRAGTSLVDMIKEDLIAERIAVESYTDMVAFLDGKDHTTRRMLESILAVEEEHAEELASMLKNVHSMVGMHFQGANSNGA